MNKNTMKKIYFIFNISLFLGLILTINSCSQEIAVNDIKQETGVWHSAKVNFNIACTDFDQGDGATRSTKDAWQDGDVVYLLLTDKDGNKVQAYVRYDGAKQKWGDVMYESYTRNITCTTERKAEAYIIEGVNDLQNQTLSLSNDKAIYACTEGTYIFPEGGDMTVTVSLAPLLGRIRFEGASGTAATIGGLMTYTSFSRTTGEFITSTEDISTTVDSNGTTPYIYSVFADTKSPQMTIITDNTYRTVFDASSSVLKPGKSGFLSLPTNEDHRGWITIVDVTGITLDQSSVSLELGSTTQLTATVSPDNAYDKSVTWSSSNTAVATVDNNGKVTAVAEGTTTITVQSVFNVNIKATCQVTVVVQGVTGITLDKTRVSLEPGSMTQLTPTVYPDNAYDKSITWNSSNTDVATVDNNGKVTAISEGISLITVQSVRNSNIKATCQVTVSTDRAFTVGGVTFIMKLVEAGTFQMGGTEYDWEKPIHSVTITKNYYIGETEVTQALWKAVTGHSPTTDGNTWSTTDGIGDNYPAYYISYEDVQKFITKLNSMTGENFRMPTEAEWEFAARGGNKSKGYTYSGSNTIGNVAWYNGNASRTNIVKTKAANELGIYDMSGNVWEFCSDWYGSYSSSAQTNPTGSATGTDRVVRGGGYYFDSTLCRCTHRSYGPPSSRGSGVGFRLAL